MFVQFLFLFLKIYFSFLCSNRTIRNDSGSQNNFSCFWVLFELRNRDPWLLEFSNIHEFFFLFLTFFLSIGFNIIFWKNKKWYVKKYHFFGTKFQISNVRFYDDIKTSVSILVMLLLTKKKIDFWHISVCQKSFIF